ncbi:PspC domain-containing protein [bacterium]|nr:PspC domain-containing protein [bacterium]
MAKKRLYRSKSDRMFGGVLGGVAEYFDIDAGLLRVLWVLLTVFTGVFLCLFVYVCALFIIPNQVKITKS